MDDHEYIKYESGRESTWLTVEKNSKMGTHYVYILQCEKGKRYCGITYNVIKRLTEHISGHGAKFTKGFIPIDLLHVEIVSSYREAINRETEIKKMMRKRIDIEYSIIPRYRIIFTTIKQMMIHHDWQHVMKELNAIEKGGYDEPGTE
jgi:putative endonuclease